MAEASHRKDLDWDDLSAPVPLDHIDPAFPAQAEPDRQPGSRSEILTREESEAVANMPHETGAPPRSDVDSDSDSGDEPTAPTLEMTIRMPVAAAAPSADATLFDAGENDFAGIRADMVAQAEADKAAALKAEEEEATQQARLQQWMANAQARLLKADADLTGPGGRVRVRRDHSPSLYRLAELQKTMIVDASAGSEPTLAETPDARARLLEAGRLPGMPDMPVDPMATIMVTREQFLGLKPAPENPNGTPAADADPAKPETPFKTGAIINLSSLPPVGPVRSPHAPLRDDSPAGTSASDGPSAHPGANRGLRTTRMSGPGGGAPMTREEALTRKIALLREAAEGHDKDVLAMMEDSSGRNALHLTLAALVLFAILVLGVGLFAATQSGMFDGLENRFTFLRPNVSAQMPVRDRDPSAPASDADADAAVRPAPSETPAPAALAAEPDPRSEPSASPTPALTRPAPSASGRAGTRPAAPKPGRRPGGTGAAPAIDRSAAGDGETRSDGTSLSERILRSSLQSSVNIDLANLQELYNRYALGFPGLSGEIVMGLTVRPDGTIREGAVVRSTTGVEAFNQEVLHRIVAWRLRAIPETAPKFTTFTLLFPLQGR